MFPSPKAWNFRGVSVFPGVVPTVLHPILAAPETVLLGLALLIGLHPKKLCFSTWRNHVCISGCGLIKNVKWLN